DDHAQAIELERFQGDDRAAVVPVEVAAFAFVIEQAVAVTEADFAGHAVHRGSSRERKPKIIVGDGERGALAPRARMASGTAFSHGGLTPPARPLADPARVALTPRPAGPMMGHSF